MVLWTSNWLRLWKKQEIRVGCLGRMLRGFSGRGTWVTQGNRLFADWGCEKVPVLSGCEAHFLLTPCQTRRIFWYWIRGWFSSETSGWEMPSWKEAWKCCTAGAEGCLEELCWNWRAAHWEKQRRGWSFAGVFQFVFWDAICRNAWTLEGGAPQLCGCSEVQRFQSRFSS